MELRLATGKATCLSGNLSKLIPAHTFTDVITRAGINMQLHNTSFTFGNNFASGTAQYFLPGIFVSYNPSWENPDDMSMAPSGLLSQTLQSSSTTAEDVIYDCFDRSSVTPWRVNRKPCERLSNYHQTTKTENYLQLGLFKESKTVYYRCVYCCGGAGWCATNIAKCRQLQSDDMMLQEDMRIQWNDLSSLKIWVDISGF